MGQSEATRTLLVQKGKGEQFRITIPADCKVTFSKVIPQGDRSFEATYALRIYKTESQQLAVFCGVTGFRDLSLRFEREVVTESGEVTWEQGEDGFTQRKQVRRKVSVVTD